jgi:uncharacterized iron-regulated membrane protein
MSSLRLIHRIIGLFVAIPVILVSLSGGLLLLRDPYYRARFPVLAEEITSGQISRQADALTAIERQFERDGIRVIKFPRVGMNAYHAYLADGSEAFIDPRTDRVITRYRWSDSPPAFLFDLHAHLLMAATGETLNGFAALALVFLGLTGLVLWLPRRAAFALRRALPRRAAPGEMLRSHAASGVFLLLPVVLFAATGAALVFYEQTSVIVTRIFDSKPAIEPSAAVTRRDAPFRPWGEIMEAVERSLPESGPRMYYPGTAANPVLTFRKSLPGEWHPNGRSYVLVDPYAARVVQAIDARDQGAGTRAMHAMYPVHGAFVGRALLIPLAVIAALGLTWLAVGGTWAYLGKLQAGRRRSRTGDSIVVRPTTPRTAATERP